MIRWLLSFFLLGSSVTPAFSSTPHTGPESAEVQKTKKDADVQNRIRRSCLDLPIQFEKNEGQTDPQVRFQAHGQGYSFFLTPAEAVLKFRSPDDKLGILGQEKRSPIGRFEVVRMRIQKGNRLCRFYGEEKTGSEINYFIGNDPGRWIEQIENFGRVKLEEVYPGIDMAYYGRQGQLEYDFIVKPGADPADIKLRFDGVRGLDIGKRGELRLRINTRDVEFKAPTFFQWIHGHKSQVAGWFVLLGGHQVGFKVGEYERTQPLVIDPTLVYSTYVGGLNEDRGNGIAVDNSGNAYVVGNTAGGFPTTGGVYQSTYGGGNYDAYVMKLNPTGTAVVYSTYLGGNGYDYGYSIALDGGGNAYVTGVTGSSNFPITGGAYQTVFGGGSLDAFVTKLNANGSGLIYSTYIGGTGNDTGYGIKVDGGGNAYVTGVTDGGFPTTAGSYQTTFGGGSRDGFIVKLNPSGTGLVYSTYLGGSGDDDTVAIAIDGSGNAYVTGETTGNFPTTAGAFQTTFGGGLLAGDVLVAKLNSAGSALIYSTYLGGSSDDYAMAIAVDSSGNAYVTGETISPNYPTTAGAYQTTLGGCGDVFITKLNSTGSALAYSTLFGGVSCEEGQGIAVDTLGDAYVAGWTTGAFPTTAGAYQPNYGGGIYDAFVLEMNPTGSAPVFSTFLGGSNGDFANAIALDNSGGIYVTGWTMGSFPTTAGAYQTAFGGSFDAFVAKFQNLSPTPTFTYTPTPTFTPTFTPTGTLTPPVTPSATPTTTSLLSGCGNPIYVPKNLYRPSHDLSLTIQTEICYHGVYSLRIYNSAGELVRTLRNVDDQPVGMDQAVWDGHNNSGQMVASGVYLIRMVSSYSTHTARLLVVR